MRACAAHLINLAPVLSSLLSFSLLHTQMGSILKRRRPAQSPNSNEIFLVGRLRLGLGLFLVRVEDKRKQICSFEKERSQFEYISIALFCFLRPNTQILDRREIQFRLSRLLRFVSFRRRRRRRNETDTCNYLRPFNRMYARENLKKSSKL